MFATLLSAAFLATTAFTGVVAELSIETPTEITQCGDAQIKWADAGQAPYSILVVNPDDPCGEEIWDLGADHNGLSMTWYTVPLPAGTKVQFYIETEEDDGWSGALTVAESDDYSCLPEELQPQTSSSSSSSSDTVDATTLVVSNTATAARTSTSAEPTTSLTPVGAAGADTIGGSDGALVSQFSAPLMAFSAFVAAFALL